MLLQRAAHRRQLLAAIALWAGSKRVGAFSRRRWGGNSRRADAGCQGLQRGNLLAVPPSRARHLAGGAALRWPRRRDDQRDLF